MKQFYNIGFTGTREGMTAKQAEHLIDIFKRFLIFHHTCFFHHGMCVGSDAQAHQQAKCHGFNIIGHPPIDMSLMMKDYEAKDFYELRARKRYLQRNDQIVYVSNLLIATPGQMQEQLQGGTWYTIRKARGFAVKHLIIWPDGTEEYHRL